MGSTSGSTGGETDHFSALGLPRQVELSRDDVEDAYLAQAKAWHPDQFAGGDPAQRRLALARTESLNVAYRIVRDPVRRAEYLVKLGGTDLDSSDAHGGAPDPGAAFLVEMIERRETLAEARAQGEAAVEDLRAGVEDEAEAAFDRALVALKAGDPTQAAHQLVVRRYLARLIEEIDGDAA